jgi:hypothetical protein
MPATSRCRSCSRDSVAAACTADLVAATRCWSSSTRREKSMLPLGLRQLPGRVQARPTCCPHGRPEGGRLASVRSPTHCGKGPETATHGDLRRRGGRRGRAPHDAAPTPQARAGVPVAVPLLAGHLQPGLELRRVRHRDLQEQHQVVGRDPVAQALLVRLAVRTAQPCASSRTRTSWWLTWCRWAAPAATAVAPGAGRSTAVSWRLRARAEITRPLRASWHR